MLTFFCACKCLDRPSATISNFLSFFPDYKYQVPPADVEIVQCNSFCGLISLHAFFRVIALPMGNIQQAVVSFLPTFKQRRQIPKKCLALKEKAVDQKCSKVQ